MTTRQTEPLCLRIAGGLLLVIGVAHIFMPKWGYASATASNMEETARDHFYYLGTSAMCSFLLAFGTLSIVHSFAAGTRTARMFSFVMAVVWSLRLALEFAFLVELQIFLLRRPHPVHRHLR